MNDSNNEQDNAKRRTEADNRAANESSDFVVGVVTFIVFLIFMTGWMYFMA